MKNHNLLLVDDEENILRTLKRTLFNDSYMFFSANNAEEARKILNTKNFDLIISDQKMPGQSGIEFLEATVSEFPEVIRILLTGYADLETALRAVNNGCIYKFLLKPWQNEDLIITVKHALEQRDLILENRALTAQLKIKNAVLEDLEKKYPGITNVPENKIFEINTDGQFNDTEK